MHLGRNITYERLLSLCSIIANAIHGHISYILEAYSKSHNDFSLMGRKQNEILQFK